MQNETQNPNQQTRFIPISKWSDFHPWPPVGGLRHLLFHRETNGLNSAVVQCGKRLLINEAKFFEWLESQGQN